MSLEVVVHEHEAEALLDYEQLTVTVSHQNLFKWNTHAVHVVVSSLSYFFIGIKGEDESFLSGYFLLKEYFIQSLNSLRILIILVCLVIDLFHTDSIWKAEVFYYLGSFTDGVIFLLRALLNQILRDKSLDITLNSFK